MKLQDLRIGNWYLSTKFQTPVKCTLGDMAEIYARLNGAEEQYADVDEIFQPLPLTEEWLKRAGFKAPHPCSNFVFNDIELSSATRVVRTMERRNFYLDGEIPEPLKIKIDYVHQLQDLYFALTGNELNIEL